MIDDNNLLENDKIEEVKDESCVTKPRACKNCSCGRKEAED